VLKPVLLNRSDIDSRPWDLLIADSLHPVIYGFSWYLDIVCESWQALVWPSAQEYQIVMPLPVRKRMGLAVIYQPHFCQFLGIFSKSEVTGEVAHSFLKSCFFHFFYISSYSFHPDLSDTIGPLSTIFPAITFTNQYTFRKSLALNQPYHPDRKRNLRRGVEYNWIMEDEENPDRLISLFSTHHSGNIEGGVSVRSYKILERLIDAFRIHGDVTLRYALLKGNVHAGILIFKYGGYSVYIFNAADGVGRKGNARTVMLDHYFQEHQGTDLLFDFESAQEPDILAFYKSFGGVESSFFSIGKTRLRFPLSYFQYIRRQMIRTRRALLLILCKT
jgi:hypothetical protein